MNPPLPTLSLLEARVLGVLAEKQRTVPDSYPLTLNALVAGCNQKTSRQPILEISDAEAQAAIDSLKGRSLVSETSGGRVYRYAHNVDGVLRIPSQSIILLTVLMLRGPQTAGELRIACERMHNFADISAVEGFLEEMAARPAGSLVTRLARLPGARESRWAHLLSGTPAEELTAGGVPGADAASLGEVAALKANVARLETEVAALREHVARICSELGMSTDPAPR
ncbi:MAG TPA: YceH family protein [Variovorax sp.]